MNSKLKDLVLNEQCELAVTLMLGQKWSVRRIVDLILDAVNLDGIWERVKNEGEKVGRPCVRYGYPTYETRRIDLSLLSEYIFIIDEYEDGPNWRFLYDKLKLMDSDDYNRVVFINKVKQRITSQLERDINTKFRDLIVKNYKKWNMKTS